MRDTEHIEADEGGLDTEPVDAGHVEACEADDGYLDAEHQRRARRR